MEYSNFYCPGFDEAFVLKKHEKETPPATIMTEEWDPDSLAVVIPVGLSDCPKMNTKYADLLQNLGVNDMNNKQIMEELESVLGIRTSGDSEESMQWVPVQHDGERNQRIHSQLVFLRLYKRWSINSIATKLSMQVHEVRRVLKEYKRKLKAIRRAHANETTQNRRKLKTYHLQTLESSLDGRKGTRITVSKLKRDLTQNHPELDGISDFCIRDALKNHWAFSFKKLERASKLSTESGRVRVFHESAKVLLNLLQGEIETIFFDEF